MYSGFQGKKSDIFILANPARIPDKIEKSIMGTGFKVDFDNFFNSMDMTSTKLERTETVKATLVVTVMSTLMQERFPKNKFNSDIPLI